jgi:hypothetical protein
VKRSLLALSLLLLLACREESSTAPPAERPLFTVRGWASYRDQPDSLAHDYSGIHVTLVGTSYEGFTDTSGAFRIDSVEAGRYVVLFSSPGYDTMVYSNLDLLVGAPFGAVLSERSLHPRSDIHVTFDSVQVEYNSLGVYAHVTQPDSFMGYAYAYTQAFFGRTREVSGDWESYEAYDWLDLVGSSTGDSVQFTTFIELDSLRYPHVPFGKHGFNSGDSVYLVTYDIGRELAYYSWYILPNSRKIHWLNLRNRSNVVGFVMP